MKKIIGFVAVLVMAIGLVACGASKKPDTEDAHIPGEPDVVGSIKMNQDEKKTLQHPSKSPI